MVTAVVAAVVATAAAAATVAVIVMTEVIAVNVMVMAVAVMAGKSLSFVFLEVFFFGEARLRCCLAKEQRVPFINSQCSFIKKNTSDGS